MSRRILTAGTVLALLAFLWTPRLALAQQGERLYEWSGHYGGASNGYGTNFGPTGVAEPGPEAFSLEQQPLQPLTATGQGPGNGQPTNRPALINVTAPPSAEIWFDDAKTTQSGPMRQFVSPPLTPGHDYSYQIKAVWNESGQKKTQNRTITVHAGDMINVSLVPAQ